MTKVGTKIVCKAINTPTNNGRQPLTINSIYEIEYVNDNSLIGSNRIDFTIKGDNGDYTIMSNDRTFFYIWDYFYSAAEWREKQINSILED
jgi:hypothetical protein